MTLVIKSLDGARVPGAGEAIFFDVPKMNASYQITINTAPAGTYYIILQCTLDGSNWINMYTLDSQGGFIGKVNFYPFIGLRASVLTSDPQPTPFSIDAWIAAA